MYKINFFICFQIVKNVYLHAFVLIFILTFVSTSHAEIVDNISEDFIDFSLEELMNIEIITASKRPEKLVNAAASIFAITQEDIRRSGATCLPELLRMVPGLNVGRIDSNKWAVSTRGFNVRFANKLLVLIDGRTLYVNCYAGVYWELQEIMLEDIERIEVIRGPGATLWGANAVNGVINIITKHASNTKGGLLAFGTGSEEKGFVNLRYGKPLGDKTFGRIYTKFYKHDGVEDYTGNDLGDDWETVRSGFRVDSQIGNNKLFVEGDFFTTKIDQIYDSPILNYPYYSIVEDRTKTSGWNILGSYNKSFSPSSELTIQGYYDYLDLDISLVGMELQNFDLDLQYSFILNQKHHLICGVGYRYSEDQYSNSTLMSFFPDNQNDDLYSAFIQDKITLIEDLLWLTIGSKYEHNDYSGSEFQPSGRLFWNISPTHKLWAAVSRAVRTPSRMEQDIRLLNNIIPPSTPGLNPYDFPVPIYLLGNVDYDSEDVIAYELGYRFMPIAKLSLDMTTFLNDYKDLRTARINQTNMIFTNELNCTSYGFELAAKWKAAEWWQWDLAYSYLHFDFNFNDQIQFAGQNLDQISNSSSPKNQISIRSFIELTKNLDLNLWGRYTDHAKAITLRKISQVEIDHYFTLDINLIFRPWDNIEISITGQNLLENSHPEYVQEIFTINTEIERSVYGKVTWQF